MKKEYVSPELSELGTMVELTAALGTHSHPDQSEFPEIPASNGSWDICYNNDPTQVC